MRASRLLSLLLLLQNRGRLTAAQLAAELEVSERTVYRDVESLSAAGIPVYAERGAGGGEATVTSTTSITGDSGATGPVGTITHSRVGATSSSCEASTR